MANTDRQSADPSAQTPVSPQSLREADLERVLLFAPTGRDGVLIADALTRAGFLAHPCRSIQHLCDELHAGAGAAFLAEEALVADAMACLRQSMQEQPPWSDLPVIVMTSGGKTTQYSERMARSLVNVS